MDIRHYFLGIVTPFNFFCTEDEAVQVVKRLYPLIGRRELKQPITAVHTTRCKVLSDVLNQQYKYRQWVTYRAGDSSTWIGHMRACMYHVTGDDGVVAIRREGPMPCELVRLKTACEWTGTAWREIVV